MPPEERPLLERVTAVILAAGESRRFGDAKLLARLEDRPLLQHVLDAANASGVDEIVLVVGHRRDELVRAVRPGRARIVVNEDYVSGQSSSLRAGLRAAGDAEAVVVLLGDQPRVSARLVDALIERARATNASAVVCASNGRRSPPTLLRRVLWPALEALEGDVGAREVLAGRDDVAVFDVTAEVGALDDVDERSDLDAISRHGLSSDIRNA